jgi:hypothetical protein
MHPYQWPKGASKVGYLTSDQVSERFQVKEALTIKSGNFSIKYSVAMQRGYYRKLTYCFNNNDMYVPCVCSRLTVSTFLLSLMVNSVWPGQTMSRLFSWWWLSRNALALRLWWSWFKRPWLWMHLVLLFSMSIRGKHVCHYIGLIFSLTSSYLNENIAIPSFLALLKGSMNQT